MEDLVFYHSQNMESQNNAQRIGKGNAKKGGAFPDSGDDMLNKLLSMADKNHQLIEYASVAWRYVNFITQEQVTPCTHRYGAMRVF